MRYKNLDEQALLNLAEHIALETAAPKVFCLYGDLGAGKSTFCRHFIRTLMEDPNYVVPSPTFTLYQEYESPKGTIYHFDLYRLTDTDDLVELNMEEALASGICLIEWPMEGFLPKERVDIHIHDSENNLRNVDISYLPD